MNHKRLRTTALENKHGNRKEAHFVEISAFICCKTLLLKISTNLRNKHDMATLMIEVTSRHMECTLLTPDYSQMPVVALQWSTAKELHLSRCSWTAAPSIKQQKPSLSRRAQTSRTPFHQCLDGNFIHFGRQAYLSHQWRGRHVKASATSMLQTTNQKSPTAVLNYKPNEFQA